MDSLGLLRYYTYTHYRIDLAEAPSMSDPAPASPGRAASGLYIRSTSAYLAWVGRLARHCRRTLADAVADALALLAHEVGFDEPPPARVVDPRRAGRKVDPVGPEKASG